MRSKHFGIRCTIGIASAIVIITSYCLYSVFYSDAVATEGYVYLPSGSTYETAIDSLTNGKAHIKSLNKFRIAAAAYSLEDGLCAGRYRLTKGTTYTTLARMFKHGLQTPVRLTFNNIRTLPQLAGRLAQQIEPDSATLSAVLTCDTIARQYGFTPQTFVSMFIPNTYEIYWNTSVEGLLSRMQKEYNRFWDTSRTEKLTASKLSRDQVITLASIVYQESKMSNEMPIIAGVYMNRLRIGMPLQADPTVKFAVGDFTLRRILARHLAVDSPYNTYRNQGLPPGPICMPSVKAIDAVLNFATHKYLYFCAKPDFSGYHNFATTLAEHNRNAAVYTAALNRNKIFK